MLKNYINDNEHEESENNPETESCEEQIGQITDCGIVPTKNAEHAIHILTIIGLIVIIDSI